MITAYLFRSLDRKVSIAIIILFAIALLVPFANLIIPADSAFHLPTYLVSLFGKYLCYALLALSLDLVWGFCGILSLGHGAFFALGGYAMGVWFYATAAANFVAGVIGDYAAVPKGAAPAAEASIYEHGFFVYGLMAIAAGIILLVLAPFLKRLMHNRDDSGH